MSEETEGAGNGSERVDAGINPAAMLALGSASREKADTYLEEQAKLARLQAEELSHVLGLRHWSLWVRHLSGLLKLTFEIGLAVATVGLVCFIAATVWNAAHSNDLVIDSFQVPPGLAARGLSGPVVAAKLSDKVAAMQAQTFSQRSPKSYANGLSEGLKLEIPETGVSLSELDRFLREKLGHDLHIGGEMVEAGNGIALTARVGSTGSATVTGAEADMDALLQKLAEQVYRITQPYRFATWLPANRGGERVAVLKELAASGLPGERAWAYNGWGISISQSQSDRAGRALLQQGFALDPNHYLLRSNLAVDDNRLGRTEGSLRGTQAALALLSAHGKDYTPPDRIDSATHGYRAIVLFHQGDLLEAAEQSRLVNRAGATLFVGSNTGFIVEILAALHEPVAARAALADYPKVPAVIANAGSYSIQLLRARMLAALAEQNWPAVLAAEQNVAPLAAQYPGLTELRSTFFDPSVALALAHLGQFAAAEARLKPMPGDCYPCLRARAQVAALQDQDARADFWFARAAAIAPSSPYAESEWGQSLLARAKPDGAIAQFTIANKKGPHFADPLEGWGEALMAKNQSHLALAKFAEAEKYAPNWGRLHLKWGEALYYAGKKDEAKKQFARAAQLDLVASDKAALEKWTAPQGR